MSLSKSLLGFSPILDAIIRDFAFLASWYGDFHPANTGDVSQVLDPALAAALSARFANSASRWFAIERMEDLATIRADGRGGYRGQGIRHPDYFELIKGMGGRIFLITSTGSQLPAIGQTLSEGECGRLLNLIEVDPAARQIRILYGNTEFGTLPSIETHVHILANAISIAEGHPSPATVHAHPYHLVLPGRDKDIRGDFGLFNALIYTQVEGLNRNCEELIGIVTYQESGSENLAVASMKALGMHRLVLWMHHGFVVREATIRRAYTLMSYAEECARAALDSLRTGACGLPLESIKAFLEARGLVADYHNACDLVARRSAADPATTPARGNGAV